MSSERLADMRRAYGGDALEEGGLAADWTTQFGRWLADAVEAGLPEPNAMVLATADGAGRPGARTVLLKEMDARGFVFFTNLRSRKASNVAANPQAALLFGWHAMQRQVEAVGRVEPVAEAESDAYFASRPRGSQLSAIVSPQSSVVAGRDELERARDALASRYATGDEIERPEHWGGLRLVPDSVEFWQGRPDRLHDRLRFRREQRGWIVERLAP